MPYVNGLGSDAKKDAIAAAKASAIAAAKTSATERVLTAQTGRGGTSSHYIEDLLHGQKPMVVYVGIAGAMIAGALYWRSRRKA